MNTENARKIGNYIGYLVRHDEPTQGSIPQKFIHIQVEVDITRKLKQSCLSEERKIHHYG